MITKTKPSSNGVALDPCLMALDSAKVFVADPTHHTGCSTFIMQTNEDVAYISDMCKLGMVYNTHEAAAKHGLAMRIVVKE